VRRLFAILVLIFVSCASWGACNTSSPCVWAYISPETALQGVSDSDAAHNLCKYMFNHWATYESGSCFFGGATYSAALFTTTTTIPVTALATAGGFSLMNSSGHWLTGADFPSSGAAISFSIHYALQ
jgi:hypothetical protein